MPTVVVCETLLDASAAAAGPVAANVRSTAAVPLIRDLRTSNLPWADPTPTRTSTIEIDEH